MQTEGRGGKKNEEKGEGRREKDRKSGHLKINNLTTDQCLEQFKHH